MTKYQRKMAWAIAIFLLATSAASLLVRQKLEGAAPSGRTGFANLIPTAFQDWKAVARPGVEIVDPRLQNFVDSLYSEVVERVYVNNQGYAVMLSVAYGPDQRESAKAHSPEQCYLGQGFYVRDMESVTLSTSFGAIPAAQFIATKGHRVEPVVYWRLVGDKAVKGWQLRLVELGYVLRGKVPDGLIFRISSVNGDQSGASQIHMDFVSQLLQAIDANDRKLLTGIVGPKSR